MTTHTAVLTGDAVRHVFRRSAHVTTGGAPRADAVFGELRNPAVRPRSSQRTLRALADAHVTG